MSYLRYPEKDLHKLQITEKDIIADINAVCRKYHLSCFAMFGTLLGAVRHHGFIPWDDDVDLAMVREDYDKFRSIFDQELGDKYDFYSPDDYNPYYSFVPKVCLKKTLLQTELAKRADMDRIGIFVEIWPLEHMSPSQAEFEQQCKKTGMLKKYLIARAVKHPYTEKGNACMKTVKTTAKYLLRAWTYLTGWSLKKINQRYVELTNLHLDTDRLMYYCDEIVKKQLVISEKDLFPLQEVAFEDIRISIPASYDTLLKQEYGDYMQLPPENERWNQAPVKIIFPDGEMVEFKKEHDA